MTSPAPLPVTPLHFVDLRLEHERVSQQFRLGKIVALTICAGLSLFVGLTAWAAVGGAAGLIFGVLVMVLLLGGVGGAMLVSAAKEKHCAGPAGTGPSSLGQVLTNAPGPQVWEAVNAALREQKFVAPGRRIDPQTTVSSRSLTMASWGETLTVRIVATHDGHGLVTVWSRPAYPLQWLDYGRNRRYVNAILSAIPGATPVT